MAKRKSKSSQRAIRIKRTENRKWMKDWRAMGKGKTSADPKPMQNVQSTEIQLLDESESEPMEFGIDQAYQIEIDQLQRPNYQLSTLMITFLISFFRSPSVKIVDLFGEMLAGHLVGDLDTALCDVSGTFRTCSVIYIPLCHSGHWVLLKYIPGTDTLKVFNSLNSISLASAVRTITNCLNSVYAREIREEIVQCPQQTNTVDCGFFTVIFLILDIFQLNVSDLRVESQDLREYIKRCFREQSFASCYQFFQSHQQDRIQDQPSSTLAFPNFSPAHPCPKLKHHHRFQVQEQPSSTPKFRKPIKAKKQDQFLLSALDVERVNNTPEHYLGPMNVVCRHCRALFFIGEQQSCCKNGQLSSVLMPKLLAIEDLPEAFKELYNARSALSEEFFQKHRMLNSIFSLASNGFSGGLTRDQAIQVNSSLGGFSVVIHGQLFHQISPLLPRPGTERTGSQVLFYDSHWEELQRRGKLCEGNKSPVSEELLKVIQDVLHLNNKLYKVYKPIGLQAINEENVVSMVIVDDFRKFRIKKSEQKLYERPSVDELAGLITEKGEQHFKRDIRVQKIGEKLQRISESHPANDPLGFALLFVKGTLGWSPEMVFKAVKKTRNVSAVSADSDQEPPSDADDEFLDACHSDTKRIKPKTTLATLTLFMYMNFFLHIRNGTFNLLFKAKRLFHQYIVTKWIDIETIRLDYLRKHQKELRRDLYRGLMDACARGQTAGDIGKAFVLPATHSGSPRQMFELYQDAMAIVCKFGKPDLFVTFTCNPKWREIQENLLPGQSAWDRPDLICRVFKLKLDEFLDDLYKKNVFGKVKAGVHVIEFQKRGLPHCHCLIILEDEYKLKTARQIDSCIRAEIPNKEEFPVLYDRVLKHMIHLPCESEFRKCKKGRGGQCNKRFPKSYQEQTLLNEDSYPLYRRRKEPPVQYSFRRAKLTVCNRFVVPYNPFLLMKFNAHINVEVCNTVTAVKYLYKYIYKGYDRAIVEMHGLDEISRYENCRYVSSIEAFWRMKENYSMHGRFPYVERLPVHLENGEEIQFKETDDVDDLLNKLKADTKLTAWFKVNQKHPEFKDVTYFEIPKYFTWNRTRKQWVKRSLNKLNKNRIRSVQQSENKIYEDIVVRTHSISPQDTERLYLKAVLSVKPGATSFRDLRTVKGQVYGTFRETASKLGLLDDDQIWINTLTEATAITCNSVKLVRLFSHMLIHCPLVEPDRLWKQFKEALTHQFRRGLSKEQCESAALIQISQYLNEFDRKLSDFNLPTIEIPVPDFEECTSQPAFESEHEFDQLTSEQSLIYSKVERSLKARLNSDEANDHLFFIDAPGGTGKTFLLNTIIKGMLKEGHNVLAVAHTGVAAMLLHNGRTAHSTFKLPLNIGDDEQPFCNIKRGSDLAESLKTVDLIVWDEISMTSNRTLACLERTLRDICKNDALFANKSMLFSGDFRQVLPIVQHGTREDVTGQIVKNSEYWALVEQLELTENLRMRDPESAKYLNDIGLGLIEPNEDGEVEIDPRLIHKGDLSSFIDHFYGQDFSEDDSGKYQNSIILAPLNEDVHELNSLILSRLRSRQKPRTYLSLDTVCSKHEKFFVSTEILNSINQSGLPLHRLELKTGATAFLLRNIDQQLGLCNGTRILIKDLAENLITAQVLTGKSKGTIIHIPRFLLYSDESQPIQFTRRQFPIRLAFSSTIHKVQGQSLDHVGIYLKNDVFCHGQLYVALTRARRFLNNKIFFADPNKTTTPNIVYPEVIQTLARELKQNCKIVKAEKIEDE